MFFIRRWSFRCALLWIAFVLPTFIAPSNGPKEEVTRSRLRAFGTAYARWVLDHDQPCPERLEDLAYYIPNVSHVQDVWGRELVMFCSANHFRVMSAGRDGRLFTQDDLTSR